METLIHKNFDAYLRITGELSTWVAVASFVVGTMLFGAYQIFRREEIIVFGFMYVAVAVLLNAVVLANLFILFCKEPKHREYFAIKMLIIIANLPIACLYFTILY